MSLYLEQLERIKRWLDLIKRPNIDREQYVDFLWAFFQNCWHLTDWITHDPSASMQLKNAKGKAKKLDSLRMVEKLADGSKHLVPKKKRMIGDIHVRIPNGTTYTYRVFDDKTGKWIDTLMLV